jgi:hypothetical protein
MTLIYKIWNFYFVLVTLLLILTQEANTISRTVNFLFVNLEQFCEAFFCHLPWPDFHFFDQLFATFKRQFQSAEQKLKPLKRWATTKPVLAGGREELPKWKWFIVFLSMIVFLFFFPPIHFELKKSLFSRSVCVPTNIIGWPNKRSGKGFFFWGAKEGKIGWTGKLSRESLLNYRHLELF